MRKWWRPEDIPIPESSGFLLIPDRQAVAEAMELVHVTTLKNKDFSEDSATDRGRE